MFLHKMIRLIAAPTSIAAVLCFFGFSFFSLVPVCADSISGSANFENPNIPNGPTGDPVPVFSTITIMQSGFIEDISVTIQGIQHTNVGDLIAELRYLSGGGTNDPAYLFFRANVDDTDTLGSRSNLDGDYTFTTNMADRNFWSETAVNDDAVIDGTLPFFASDVNGDFHDLGGPDFFEGFNTFGQWQLVISDANGFGNNVGTVQAWTIDFQVSAIPEPASAILLMLASSFAGFRRRR